VLAGRFPAEPGWVDLRDCRSAVGGEAPGGSAASVDLGDRVADFAAPIRDVAKDKLVGEHLRLRRRTRQTVGVVLAALAVLTLLASSAAVLAVGQRDRARAQERQALSRQFAAESLLAADADPRRSMELARRAWQTGQSAEARSALLSAQMSSYAGQVGEATDGQSVALTPDGTVLAVGYGDGRVRLWDTATRAPAGPDLVGHTTPVASVAFSPDGTMLAAAAPGDRDSVRVWELPGGRLLRSLPEPGAGFVAWRPGGRQTLVDLRLGMVDRHFGWLLDRWDPRTGEQQAAIPVGGTASSDVSVDAAVSPDGAWAAVGRVDGGVGVWDLAHGTLATTVPGQAGGPVRVALGPGGMGGMLATADTDGRVVLWALPAGTRVRELTTEGDYERQAPGRIVFSPDGRRLHALGAQGSVQSWSVPLGLRLSPALPGGLTGQPQGLAVSGDGTLAAVASPGAPPTLVRLDALLGHPATVIDVAFDPSGKRLATAAADGTVRVWDLATRKLLHTVRHGRDATSVAYAPDGTLASAAADGTVRIVDPAGNERAVLTVGEGISHDLAFSPDGRLLAMIWQPEVAFDASVLHRKTKIYVWQAQALHQRSAIDTGTLVPTALEFTPDSALLLAATDTAEISPDGVHPHSTLRAWRTGDLSRKPAVDLGDDPVLDIAAGPDGRTLAVGGFSRMIELRSVDGALLRTFGTHPAAIRGMAFSPDGRTLATVTVNDPVVRLWDVGSGALLANLTGHVGPPNAVAFSPDGTLIASGATDASAGLWRTDPATADRYLCRVLEGIQRCR
jgi:WD40 repeat protein